MHLRTVAVSSALCSLFSVLCSTLPAQIDRPTGRLLSVKETGASGERATDNEFLIDYEKRRATYTDRVRPSRSGELALPAGGDPIDLISALVQTRDWNLKPGEKRDVVVQFGRDFYPLSIYAERFEDVVRIGRPADEIVAALHIVALLHVDDAALGDQLLVRLAAVVGVANGLDL